MKNWRHTIWDDRVLLPVQEPPLAAHLVTSRALYAHHGIHVGDRRVIHFGCLAFGVRGGQVQVVTLARFAREHGKWVRTDPRKYSEEVIGRAWSRVGERGYQLLANNCEHFCSWALKRSAQIEYLRSLFVPSPLRCGEGRSAKAWQLFDLLMHARARRLTQISAGASICLLKGCA